MSKKGPFVAWLEDDEPLLFEIREFIHFTIPHVPLYFSSTFAGFWKCLHKYSPEIIFIDVMLPEIPHREVKRMAEGIAIAKWIRDCRMPDGPADVLNIPTEMRGLSSKHYQTVPINFVTGRTSKVLAEEIKAVGLESCQIIEKGSGDEESGAIDQAVDKITDAWKSRNVSS